MATWQWTVHLVPAQLAPRPDTVLPREERLELLDRDWPGSLAPALLAERIALRFALPSAERSVGKRLVVERWGGYETNLVSVSRQIGGPVASVMIRIDARNPLSTDAVALFAAELGCVLVESNGAVLRAEAAVIEQAYLRSDAVAFVADPRRFIALLAKQRLNQS